MKGWIALDIDGTITADKYSVPGPVAAYLKELEREGWKIAIATGRASAFALAVLSNFDFPFRLLVQNGSAVLGMPDRELVYKHYLTESSLDVLQEAFEGIQGGFLVYSGVESGGFCYYMPDRLSDEQVRYVFRLQERERELARAVDSLKGVGDFPLIKCFGVEEEMAKLAKKLRQTNLFQVAHIRDPFEKGGQLLLVTDLLASKGESLKRMMRLEGRGEKVIAAGDDENDESLLKAADVKIVMPQAREELRKLADLIAPPVSEMGIISALEWAVKK